MNQWAATSTMLESSSWQEDSTIQAFREVRSFGRERAWNPDRFAQEQIRGLVRQVFLSGGNRPARQIAFSAVDADTDVRNICRRVGEALAQENVGDVGIVERGLFRHAELTQTARPDGVQGIRLRSRQLLHNLWRAPCCSGDPVAGRDQLRSQLREVKRDFDFSILEAPPGGSEEAIAICQAADGVILILSACKTRRPAARGVKEKLELANIRILGTILSDRIFPIPEKIYERL